jgi:hypothetical protein
MASLGSAYLRETNRYLAAHGHAKRIRMNARNARKTENALVFTLEAEVFDAPEVEQRIGERYLQREGD